MISNNVTGVVTNDNFYGGFPMKKIVALVLALVMVLGCTAALADTYGLGISSSIGSSKDAADGQDGKAQVDSTVCALAVDADGKIVSCLFDVAQTKIGFSAAGAITADKTAEVKSKQELGDDYGMRGASAIGKEWNEQADALAAQVIELRIPNLGQTLFQHGAQGLLLVGR